MISQSSNCSLLGRLIVLYALLAACGGGSQPPATPAASEAPTAPAGPASDLDRLRALGYAGVSEESYADDESGVVLLDEARSAPGYNLYSNRHDCSAVLMDEHGELVRRWERPADRAWSNVQLLANGDLLVIGHERHEPYLKAVDEERYLLRLSWSGEELWRADINAHHDLEITPSGDLAVLSFRRALGTRFTPRGAELRVDQVQLLDLTSGAPLEVRSLVAVLRSRPEQYTLKKVRLARAGEVSYADLIHANSIEFVAPEFAARPEPLYASGNVLVSSRQQDAVFVFEWESGELIWSWGHGELSGPHDATLLENGHILIFDNGLGRGWSRVIELDPVSEEIVWEYRADPPEDFYTASRGSAQRLPNGNTLIAESDRGRAFEVTPAGERVWIWINPERTPEGKALTLVRMKRLPREYVQAILDAH